jgi:hypothetical protein
MNLTFGELVALIFISPLALTFLYALISFLWFYVTVQEKAERIIEQIKGKKGSRYD